MTEDEKLKKATLLTMFAGYPHLADKLTPFTVQSYLMALEDCSAWAVKRVVIALRRGLLESGVDYCPSAPLIASEARKWDTARAMFKDETLEQVERRLEHRAVDALPSQTELDEHTRSLMSKKILDLSVKAKFSVGDPDGRDD